MDRSSARGHQGWPGAKAQSAIFVFCLPTLLLCPKPCLGEGLTIKVFDADSAPISSAVVVAQGGPAGTGRVLLNQVKRRFEPAFLMAIRGQTLEIRNSDDAVHNSHCDSPTLKFNISLQPGKRHLLKLNKATSGLVLCHIHSEMRARLLVLESSIYGLTDKSGQVQFHKLPKHIKSFRIWSPHDGYRSSVRARRKAGLLEVKVKARRAPRRAASQPASSQESAKMLISQLASLSEALKKRSPGPGWSEQVERWRQGLFVAGGIKSALRQKVGRSDAYKFESRLRWVGQSLKLALNRSQRAAVKKVVDDLIVYLKARFER
jgi:hypothetical protein